MSKPKLCIHRVSTGEFLMSCKDLKFTVEELLKGGYKYIGQTDWTDPMADVFKRGKFIYLQGR